MGKERIPHDPAYKQFFSNPEMVESLLRDFVPADFVADLDFSTLERCSGSYVTDDLRERHDDIVWRVGWKKGSWCYVALLLEFQSTPDHWMALRILS
ncbi:MULTISPECIES: Rpn family recombination-promoting nuclease/putative transposase, partial [unclassified Desulfovibrio]|uniref:Rpn family recombination-promoting nuclease/putative transposase n=1 Tax=unclassified Desulfovibrio TaxID=2593640 RepID=UPI000FAD1F3B